MENKLTTREELKTYFETEKYPTQSQFSDLIDSLKHKEDVLTNKEMVILANSLATLENGYVQYITRNDRHFKFPIVVSQQDAEDQVIEMGNTNGYDKKQYFLGNAPYTIKAKKFEMEKLEKYEYYHVSYRIDSDTDVSTRIFGNNLPAIPEGFEFGTVKDNWFYFQLYKQTSDQQIDIVNTSIKFVNKTEAPIQYRLEGGSGNWADKYRAGDTVTDHYSFGDYLYLWYKADLREIDKSIECKVFDTNDDRLLMTCYLDAGRNNQDIWGGGQVLGLRDVRIECDYQSGGK
ncbi:hypothetical protein J3D55_003402 [Chryseobacterium ginsenosidimutans]|uniref:hypothetical protein n=1 Tax=Chryseobacterium ginsenosidimutans TaxID=687846 RepID=UPI0021691013|nr:hypothetical protein [Chryseobacterium ginsenosidimutans]MCS3870486.1 hypothetical protein [Chryseobacterium ginsenosidimutans]